MRAPTKTVRRLSGQRFAWLFLATLVLFGAGIGLRDPWPADEPRFVLNALEMIETGNWLIPHRAGEAYPDKPPVFMWAQASAILATGSVRAAFLLPSILSGLGILWLVVDLVARLHGRRIAMLAGLSLLATVQFTLQAKSAQIDIMLCFWTTLGAYGLMRHALLGPDRRWWLIACAAMGLGVITKGVGFLPLLMIPPWILLARCGAAHRPTAGDLLAGLGVMLATIAAWVVPMALYTTASGDPALLAYRDDILLRQTAERYANPWGHHQPWFYFFVEVIPWAWLPLWLALPWAVPNWWRRLKRGDARTLLPLSGVLVILAFFSLSPGKRGVYLLPTVPLLVIALAPLLPGLLGKRGLQWLATAVLALLGGAFAVGAIAGAAGFEPLTALAETHQAWPWPWWGALGAAMVALLVWLRPRRGAFALALWLGLLWISLSLFAWPDLNTSRSPRQMMHKIAAITGSDAWLALPDFGEEFVLQARQPIVHFGYSTPIERQALRAFDWLDESPQQRWLLIAREYEKLFACVDLSQATDLGFQNSQYWWLLPGSAARDCRGDGAAAPLYVAPTSLPARP